MSKTKSETQSPARVSTASWLWNYLGSMNLAITLLMLLAIASVIGTVLQQNQNYTDYLLKFGPFWFDVYDALNLYDVYGALWFSAILLFLIASTSTCIARNAMPFIREMGNWQMNLSSSVFRVQPNHQHLVLEGDHKAIEAQMAKLLAESGYRMKTKHHDASTRLVAVKGQYQKLGYLFTHAAIVIICLGAVLDSKIPLQLKEWAGELKAETRSITIKEVPEASTLNSDVLSFRGTVDIPENKRSNVVFIAYKDGYLMQRLPFEVVLKDFRIDHYDNGQPKDYESDIILIDEAAGVEIEQTIKVNHPLIYKDFAIYQSSFGDGGTKLEMTVYPLEAIGDNQIKLQSAIHKSETLNTPIGKLTVELDDFRLFNIETLTEEEQIRLGKKARNVGPALVFKLRDEQGQAHEYFNYMAPMEMEPSRYYFVSGMRKTVAEPYRYLTIPADKAQSLNRFMDWLHVLNSPAQVLDIIHGYVQQGVPESEKANVEMQSRFLQQLVRVYRKAGFEGIDHFIRTNLDSERQEKASEQYFEQLSVALRLIYFYVLEQEGTVIEDGRLSDFDIWFFDEAVKATQSITQYGQPLYFQLNSFTHIQSSGLQITKSPGKNVVYLGSLLLTIGVMLMIFVRHKSIWIDIQPQDSEKTQLSIAGRDNKNTSDFADEFTQLTDKMTRLNR